MTNEEIEVILVTDHMEEAKNKGATIHNLGWS
jgi:hypothetical protein